MLLRWIRGLRRALDEDRRRWPPLDPGPRPPTMIHGQRAGFDYPDAIVASGGQCAPLGREGDAWTYTPPSPDDVDPCAIAISEWEGPPIERNTGDDLG